ncbi:hypothetical protein NEPAR06_1042 [Nematocida parisii]|uniref:HMG box domain-containing protein n=1 Tax=Nematocida parisii (strain ERTm3) TaxID=935791 RepID=I3EFL2_NEMP3|nr:uncharacterized protein NEPG_01497 [Nematocida parisii ERTm1]EIJ88009.1 hypothetical protein NEQG_01453 [Nematocida parisii ERTm3]KAI5128408.1 hypothetical protein NEPAR08_1219 [Nematocida parisii]EIJ93925.1 hypothetical protein NEPG_01497 [Nematocida parisii ERTm1]KAI5128505.1 hypothetical protein NEPAR03_1359 [Nematocida parisii]KAI5143440.1 hypothetical protein NEPAR04_1831 [Nematocida parisii]|eukprot:XP_013059325.1 hypothetical protein NEPG_01497 [Nematocida parisii ERTm1]
MAKESITAGITKRKVKKIRGENEPKKPTTEYFMFLRDTRKQLQPGLSVKEQTKILSKMWAELKPEEKKKYSEEYAEAFKQYKIDLEEYKKTDEYHDVLKKNKQLKLVDGKKPQSNRKPSGYNLFVKEKSASIAEERGSEAPVLSLKEISQMISKKWQSLTDEEKAAYKLKALAASEEKESSVENVEP